MQDKLNKTLIECKRCEYFVSYRKDDFVVCSKSGCECLVLVMPRRKGNTMKPEKAVYCTKDVLKPDLSHIKVRTNE